MNEPVNRRYISSAGPGRDGQDDPLAELARIVGKNDPFADLFNEARSAPALRAPAAAPQITPHDDSHFDTPQLRGSMGHLDDDGWYDEPPSASLRRPMAGPYAEEAGEAEDFDDATRYADYPEEAYAPADADAYEGGRHPRTAPRRGFGLMGVTLLALVVAGGAGAYALRHGSIVSGSFANLSGTLPVIKASTDPVKIKPPAPADANTSQPTKEILDRIGQNGSNETEKIVSREELPVATVPKKVQAIRIETIPATADPAPQTTGTAVTPVVPLPTRDIAAAKPTTTATPLPTRDIAAAPVKPLATRDIGAAAPVAPLPTRDIAAATPAAGQADGPQLPAIMPSTPEPRKVRTIKVLADNSFVTGEAPAVPTRSIGDLAPPQQGLSIAPPPIVEPPKPAAVSLAPALTPVPAKVAAADPVATIPDPAPVAPPQPVLTMRGIDPPAAAPQADPAPAPATDQEPVVVAEPPVRPKNIPVTHPKPVTPVATDDAAAPKPAPVKVALADPEPVAAPAAVSGGAFVVQVSSQKTQADAMTAWQAVQRKFGAVVGGMKPSIKKAEVGDRGTFYRVRVGPWGTSAEAAAFCSKLKAAGGDCVITRN